MTNEKARSREKTMSVSSLILSMLLLSIVGCQEFMQDLKKKTDDLTVKINSLNHSITAAPNNAPPSNSPSRVVNVSNSVFTFNASSDPELALLAKGPFGGITILELREDPAWEPGVRYLVIFVSSEGNYAALARPSRIDPGCIAWVIDHTPDASSLTFGGSDASFKSRNPGLMGRPICPQFTVRAEEDGAVRVLRGQSGRKATIVARVPLQIPDWSMPIFDRHAINGIRLGPVDYSAKNTVLAGIREPHELAALQDRTLISFLENAPADPGDRKMVPPKPIHGFYATRNMTGWPIDLRVITWYMGTLAQVMPRSAFNDLLQEKYGLPSFTRGSVSFWVYDLRGNKISERDASPENCLGSMELSLKFQGLPNDTGIPFRSVLGRDDLGPWGCSLVIRHVSSDKADNTVTGYMIDTVSGFGLGQSIFKARLAEVRRYKDPVSTSQLHKQN